MFTIFRSQISCWNNPHAIVSDQAVFKYSWRLTRCSAFSVTVPFPSLHQSLGKTAVLWITSTFRKATVSLFPRSTVTAILLYGVLMLRTGSPNVGCLHFQKRCRKIGFLESILTCRRAITFLLAWTLNTMNNLQDNICWCQPILRVSPSYFRRLKIILFLPLTAALNLLNWR
jgi:hypothetical protein